MDWASKIPTLLAGACLLPLASFAIILVGGRRLGRAGRGAAWIACGAIVGSFGLSTIALVGWLWINPLTPSADHGRHGAVRETNASDHDQPGARPSESAATVSPAAAGEPLCGVWYTLGEFGSSRVTVSYYIDGLTVAMFVMVSLIASCIHVYSIGYMHEELDEVTDDAVRLSDGRRLRRAGRFHRFFQHLSLFSFSMLGLIVAGNLAMVFCFWELVGICSYLLIGFYIERPAASNAANKAFIVNRVGDFGMIVGLMVFWAGLGTLSFGDIRNSSGEVVERGVFSLVRPPESRHELIVPEGFVRWSARAEIAQIARAQSPAGGAAAVALPAEQMDQWRSNGWGYGLLVLGGLGLFCGCIGKSAQFPLHVWLPDAMEGPTPVSALVHSATMVAAGVYLTARCFPIFAAEVLLTIAVVGCITLFLAATIALTATDIKRVLAYSTVSQLGYMMLALGSGGWVAGVFHLFTHAFFKSLLFLCSGSVIHACHTNELTRMGGLARKMPWTAGTMLVGCLAIVGAGIPLVGGLSGYYSKDAILAQQYVFATTNPHLSWLFYVAAIGAAMTAFYMFRLWFLAFVGKPRDAHVFDHVHESPPVMTGPLVLLAVLAVVVAWNVPLTPWGLEPLLSQATPLGINQPEFRGLAWNATVIPGEYLSHDASVHRSAALLAFAMGAAGVLLAALMYGARKLDPADVAGQFPRVYRFLLNKWWFDEIYHHLWVRPTMAVSQWTANLDRNVIDYFWDSAARGTTMIARLDDWIDRRMVDRTIDRVAEAVYRLALRLRGLQSGFVRQYVLAIAVGLIVLVVVMSLYWSSASAGW